MKKRVIAGICAAVVLVVAGAGFGIYKLVQNSADPVEVMPVSNLSTGWFGESMPTYGVITSNATQDVFLDSDELVDKVFVKEGDKVKIGDKLLAYDTTMLELDLESEKLDAQAIELQIKAAKQELERLKKITPVPDNYGGPSGGGSFDFPDDDDEDDDDEASAKQAGLIQNTSVMVTASQDGQALNQSSEQVVNGSGESESASGTESESETTGVSGEPETPATEEPNAGTDSTESEKNPEEDKPVESPLAEIKAHKTLKYDSKPYQGSGTKEDPYLFFCKDGVVIQASFMNKMLGFNEAGTSKKNGGMRGDGTGSYAVLEIREGDSITGGFVKSISINGTVKADKAYEPGITWTFTSEGVTKDVPDVSEPTDNDDDGGDDDIFGDGFGDDVYTVTELKEAIQEKEDDIKDLKLDKRESAIRVKQAQRKLDEATVTATINGVVKSVGDPELGQVGDEAFLSVTSNEGLYVKGTISELKLGKVKVGSAMTGMSYESGTNFTASITEISEYPDSSDFFGGDGNTNSSQYPFLAYIEESDGLSNNESVELSIQDESALSGDSIYLEKAYIRSENGQSYVYKADDSNRLVKQYVKTGATAYSTSIEILEGLTMEDRIAFPYGKNVKEGARVINHGEEDTEDSQDEDDEAVPDGDMGINMDGAVPMVMEE